MFGFAWSELMLIAVVALVVVGPKDLPKVTRAAAQWSRKFRALAKDFQRNLDDMVREADYQEAKREVDRAWAATAIDSKSSVVANATQTGPPVPSNNADARGG